MPIVLPFPLPSFPGSGVLPRRSFLPNERRAEPGSLEEEAGRAALECGCLRATRPPADRPYTSEQSSPYAGAKPSLGKMPLVGQR